MFDGLRRWFVIHFAVDLIFAVPLMLVPEQLLGFIGWSNIDPVAARLVAAALFGIGIESYLGRDSGPEAFRAMLNLKIIWSLAAVVALAWGLLGGSGPAWVLWALLVVFAGFNLVWVYWRLRLGRLGGEIT
jgi:hypothetical protein